VRRKRRGVVLGNEMKRRKINGIEIVIIRGTHGLVVFQCSYRPCPVKIFRHDNDNHSSTWHVPFNEVKNKIFSSYRDRKDRNKDKDREEGEFDLSRVKVKEEPLDEGKNISDRCIKHILLIINGE
jgi:hypothetical protein